MAYSSTAETLDALAAAFGDRVYLDVAKWHLYLQDAKLHTPLAEKLLPLLDTRTLSAATVDQVLQEMTVPVGGGQRQLSLKELIPAAGQADLLAILEDFERDL